MKPPAILKTPLSAVENVRRKATYTLTLEEAFKAIIGQKSASTVSEIRRLQGKGETQKAKQLKKSLPAILFAGTFSQRNNESLLQHSGLLVLDFDDCDIGKKDILGNDSHTVLCFISPRGTGIKVVVRIDPASNNKEHGESFDAAREYFLEKYGVEADKSGRDVSRLCFVSHDPEAIFNPEAEVLHRLHRQHRTTHDHIDNTGNVVRRDGVYTLDEVLVMTQPTQQGQRHKKIFDLARGLKFECGFADAPIPELKAIVRKWFDMAKPNIGTQDFDESWSDFVHAWPRAERPLSANSLEEAWAAVLAGNLPCIAQEYDNPKVQQLISLCWHLRNGKNSFYLSTHKAGELLGVKPTQVLRWLNMLQADEIIELVRKGNRAKATTYQWTKLSA